MLYVVYCCLEILLSCSGLCFYMTLENIVHIITVVCDVCCFLKRIVLCILTLKSLRHEIIFFELCVSCFLFSISIVVGYVPSRSSTVSPDSSIDSYFSKASSTFSQSVQQFSQSVRDSRCQPLSERDKDLSHLSVLSTTQLASCSQDTEFARIEGAFITGECKLHNTNYVNQYQFRF